MNKILGLALAEKSVAQRLRKEAGRDVQKLSEAIEHLGKAIGLLEPELKALNQERDEDERQYSGFFDVASELSDCLGSRGGLFRRLGRLPEAIADYDAGSKLEIDPQYRIANTYCAGNYITVSVMQEPRRLPELRGRIQRLLETVEGQQRRGLRSDFWTQADVARFNLLLGGDDRYQQALIALKKFANKGGLEDGYESTLDVLQQLQRALEGVGLVAEAARIERAVRYLVELKLRSSPGATSAPDIGEEEHHCFLSYRSTDRPIAMELVNRLEGAGLRIYIDQRELKAGDRLADSLQLAIRRSRGALIVMSEGWLESPWCREEGNALQQRQIEDPTFHVVAARIDDSEWPPFWKGRLWTDLRPAGRAISDDEIGKLVQSLVGGMGGAPPAGSAALDQALRIEAERGASPLLVRWNEIKQKGLGLRGAALTTADLLIKASRPQDALKVLDFAGDGTRARQLRALALDRSGRPDEALAILEGLFRSGQLDVETCGILGGRYKKLWYRSGLAFYLERALDRYQLAWERSRDGYPGINVAAVSLWLGNKARSREVATTIRDLLGWLRPEETDPFLLASRAEAHLLLGELHYAWDWYRRAAHAARNEFASVASMRRQARTHLEHMEMDESARTSALEHLTAALFIPAVAAFTGHRTDPPSASRPRFSEGQVRAARVEIDKALKQHNVQFCACSAARGGDLLFAQAALESNRVLRVFLPFPREQFRWTSVQNPNPQGDEDRRVSKEWGQVFDKLLEKLGTTEIVERPPTSDVEAAYAACNDDIRNHAIELAEQLDQKPILIAMWDGDSNGTGNAVRAWQAAGLPEPIVIDVAKLPSIAR